ncbi:AraC family transcriptional regulator [Coraliomargarita sp. SDUM461004]|uniref:AraC family transcriptional regulator n=1 Tax=Thalassobacterium sedimentorum TaxID=3041258 RepID=A0ABU1AGM7_9BACT|nr:AraC family transcriptional regulator [Coraliomargarita sp. SDUM461004]MDQ8193000.1 AraC family transcriptional regulator [Coraliomargarita sp. SDUM461004]
MNQFQLDAFEALPEPSNYFEGVRTADPLHVDNVLLFYRPHFLEATQHGAIRWLHSRHILVSNFGVPGVAHLNMIPYQVNQFSAILISPYELHFFTAIEQPLSAWLFMTFETETPLAFQSEQNPVITLSASHVDRLATLASWAVQRKYNTLQSNQFIAQTTELLESLRPQWSRRGTTATQIASNSSHALLNRISKHLKANPALSLSIAQLAATSDCSERHLRRMFQQRTGMPLGAFLKKYRISRIIQLVGRDGLSLSKAAEICGYSAPSALSRAFKAHTGRTPREFFKPE